MLKYELKKLFIKQYGLVALIFLLIIEMFIMSAQYTEKEFSNELTKAHYYNYISQIQGMLTLEKGKYISEENERIKSAEADLITVQTKMIMGQYENENDYLTELAELRPYIEKSDAFKMIYSAYEHASVYPENRYILPFGAEGMCRDYPDVALVLFIVGITSFYFLSEEKTGMIVLLRSCESIKKNTFISKLVALLILIFMAQALISLCEYFFLSNNIDNNILSYPVQSMVYFGSCPYHFSIVNAFVVIQILKFTGCIFIAALTILLSLTSKNPMITTACPLALCLIQQFAFFEPSNAYFLPTGLLRASGYLRGDSYETVLELTQTIQVKSFSEIPIGVLFGIISFVVVFTCTVIFIGLNFYKSCHQRKKFGRKIAAVLPFLFLMSLTSCDKTDESTKRVYYSMTRSSFMAQNDNYCYMLMDNDDETNALTEINLSNGVSNNVVKDAFRDEINISNFCLADNKLYYYEWMGYNSFVIRCISLEDYSIETIAEQDMDLNFSFLGLRRGNTVKLEKMIQAAFTDGENLFLVAYEGEVYKSDMAFKEIECIISDGVYANNLIFDGKKIYYINLNLELKFCDVNNGKNERLAGGFVKSFDLYDDEIIYSSSEGIFKLDLSENLTDKLCDMQAESISIDDKDIVFLSEGVLYLLKDGNITAINCDGIINFACLYGYDTVLYTRFDVEQGQRVCLSLEL